MTAPLPPLPKARELRHFPITSAPPFRYYTADDMLRFAKATHNATLARAGGAGAIELPEKPPKEFLAAMYAAFDFYGPGPHHMGSPEAARIYRAVREWMMQGESQP